MKSVYCMSDNDRRVYNKKESVKRVIIEMKEEKSGVSVG